jgi:hypothetical protein
MTAKARSRALSSAEERAAFRAFVRENHPDAGGDPEVFMAGLREFRERGVEDADRYDAPVTFVVSRRGVAGAVEKAKQWRSRRRRPPRVR